MSRIGKLPIAAPEGLEIVVDGRSITFNDKKIKKTYTVSSGIAVSVVGNEIKLVACDKENPNISMYIGMDRSNLSNIVKGFSSNFKTVLEINGVGYKAFLDEKNLLLTLGHSHDIFYSIPKGISVSIEKTSLITISGPDNILVGRVVSEIMSFKKTEPYKGKGIKIMGSFILRKEGKKK